MKESGLGFGAGALDAMFALMSQMSVGFGTAEVV
jgi:hypothetical protein